MPDFCPDLEMLELRLSRVTIINDHQRHQLDIAQAALVELHYLASLPSLSFDESNIADDQLQAFNNAMVFLER